MRYLLIATLLAALSAGRAAGQTLPEYNYTYPVRGVQRLYSANFGEMRPNHFHSGIDIKTDGVTGKEVVAIADGYVSRLVVQPGGYGRALYVTHNNGTMSVYGHLSKFRPDIEKYVREERIRRRKNSIELFFAPWQWKVTQGEMIALSGNTGTSYGPHLHFEIRDAATSRTMNTIAAGIIRVDDNIAPIITRLHYIEVDTLSGVPVESRKRSFDVKKTAGGEYALAADSIVKVGRNGFFVIEVSDRKNDVQNRFGIYRLSYALDGRKMFEYRMDGFTFDCSKYCNAASYYPIQLSANTEAIRMVRIDGNIRDFYPVLVSDGRISLAEGESKSMEIEVEDDCGNLSQLTLRIVGKRDQDCFRANENTAEGAKVINRRKEFRYSDEDIEVTFPGGTFYESCFFRCSRTQNGSVRALSPIYKIMDGNSPMHKSGSISIRCDVPENLRRKAVLGRLNKNGKAVYAGGRYENGAVKGSLWAGGEYFVTTDTIAPTIKPRFAEGADLSKAGSLSFSIGDNFSGMATYEGTIDGQWAIFEYMPVAGQLIHNFVDSELTRGKRHTVRMTLTDNCGNTRTVESHFYR